MALTSNDLKKIGHISEKVAQKQTEELANIVGRAFQGQQDYMDKRFEKIDEMLGDHGQQLERIENRKQIDQERFDNHDRRISRVEKVLELK